MPKSRLLLLLLSSVLLTTALVAADQKEESQVSSTSFTVLKDETGKPVRNAAVVLHPVDKNGRQMKSGFELKTDADGKTHFDGIPYGPLRVQVIAHGFQTFGDDYQINQPDQEITIRLKRPQQQLSIYQDSNSGSNGSGTTSKPPQQQ